MAHSALGLSKVELEREIRWRLREAPREPDELLEFIGHLIADVVSANNAALARQLAVGDTGRPAEEF